MSRPFWELDLDSYDRPLGVSEREWEQMNTPINVIWNDPPVPGENGEDGVTEFVSKCNTHGKAANMVYRNHGPRGAVLKGWVIGCCKECGESASGGRKASVIAQGCNIMFEPEDEDAIKAIAMNLPFP